MSTNTRPNRQSPSPQTAVDWVIIDGIGPFFRGCATRRINWSKINFDQFERDGGLDAAARAELCRDFDGFCLQVVAAGYNTVTLDDMAHMVQWTGYASPLRDKLAAYSELYKGLISIARRRGLRVLVTTDIMYFTDELRTELGHDVQRIAAWFGEALRSLFTGYPEVCGVVTRFGENDALDVTGDFHSELVLRTPRQMRRFLQQALPICEELERTLVFRTWSVGVYSVGDLIWNSRTFDRVFAGVDSSRLVISMKYGESDFFRFLPPSHLFFHSGHAKIVELQTRREYEGFGEYPSFIGWDYEAVLDKLANAEGMCGISVWCQTGGWGSARRLTYIENSSIWTELNTYVAAQLWHGKRCDAAVGDFCREHGHIHRPAFLQFLRLSDEAIANLLYVREFSRRRLYFRRVRVPPLLYVMWDRIIVNHAVRKSLRCLVTDADQALLEGERGLRAVRQMRQLAAIHQLPDQGLELQEDTFEILMAAREYFFGDFVPDIRVRLQRLGRCYARKYQSHGYSLLLDFSPARIRHHHIRWGISLLLREQHRYRVFDQVVTLRLLALIYPLLRTVRRDLVPDFAREQAMGFDTLLR